MIKKYGKVIINQLNINIDQLYDYKIPLKLTDEIKVGQRVIVPFGRGNKKIDGFVIKITDQCNINENKLKEIYQIVDRNPILNVEQLKLAHMMKNYYLCTYIEAIHTMIPSGISIEKREYIKLNPDYSMKEDKVNRETIQGQVITYLQSVQKEINIESLYGLFCDKRIKKVIKELINREIITLTEMFYKKNNDKREKYISLSGKYKLKEEYIKELSKVAHKQIEIIKNLNNIPVKYRDLKKQLNFSSSSIDSLKEKGLIHITSNLVYRNPYKDILLEDAKKLLTKEQEALVNSFEEKSKLNSQKILLHGVTGSGKTEVYLNMVEIMLKLHKQCILLVPEISLTLQMVERFVGYFGEQVSILHSGLSQGEKYDQWKQIKSGKTNIVIGARSAVFAPLKNLGVIIIDEEHETSYKSSTRPRYNAKEIAQMRSKIERCHIVFGSATPSIESFYRAKQGEYHLFSLHNRIDNIPMPEVKLIDMRNEIQEGNYSILSRELRQEIERNLQNKQQSILFLNRRGFSTFISCRECGYVEKCSSCDVSLTYHHNHKNLICHYCGYTKTAPKICPSCKSKKIKYFGTGTEKVASFIEKEFPEAKILRMDVDTTKRKGSHDKIITSFKNEEADILIGTQMVSKGLNFPKVTLVGVIIADTSLNLPDFRAAERTFQLTAQVSGRAGRGALAGRVIVQTYEPNHYSLLYAKDHDYINFYGEEIKLRKEMMYPPYKKIINIVFTLEDEQRLIREINGFHREILYAIKNSKDKNLEKDVFRPVPCPISKVKNKYRWHLILKTNKTNSFRKVLKELYYKYNEKNKDLNIAIDMNPMSIL